MPTILIQYYQEKEDYNSILSHDIKGFKSTATSYELINNI